MYSYAACVLRIAHGRGCVKSSQPEHAWRRAHRVAVERRLGRRDAESFADLAGDAHGSNVETTIVQIETASSFLDEEFVLAIGTERDGDSQAPQAWMEDHPTLPNHKPRCSRSCPGPSRRAKTPRRFFDPGSSSSRTGLGP